MCDFGLASFYGEGEPELTGRHGTIAYMAPEMLKDGGTYTEAIDLWSIGVILFILLGGYHPFDETGSAGDAEVAIKVGKGDWGFRDTCWKEISPDGRALIKRLLAPDPEQRASVSDLLNDAWVNGHTAPARPLPDSTTSQLRAFNDMRKTWRAAIRAASFVGRTPHAATAPRSNSQRLHAPSLAPGALEELKEAFHACAARPAHAHAYAVRHTRPLCASARRCGSESRPPSHAPPAGTTRTATARSSSPSSSG